MKFRCGTCKAKVDIPRDNNDLRCKKCGAWGIERLDFFRKNDKRRSWILMI